MRSLGWTLIQYDWCSYKKRKFGYRHVQRKDDVKIQEEEDHLSVKERGPEETNPVDILLLNL